MRFWKRQHGRLDAELRANRPAPPDEFVRSLARRVETRSAKSAMYGVPRVALAGAVTVLMLGALASFGGLSYAASAPVKAVKAVKDAVAPEGTVAEERAPRVVQQSSGQSQYGPRKVTICHKLPNGKQVTITISESALNAHLTNHGDSIGACP